MKAIAEAPAKTIITGEHFVVHGAWALAAALHRPVRVEAEEAKDLIVDSDRVRGRRVGASDKSGIAPILKVVRKICRENHLKPEVHLRIISGVPEGSGLGSSASTMVAVASALGKLNGLDFSRSDIMRYAMVGEGDVHGRPSGIDVATCVHGGVILFKMGLPVKALHFAGKRGFLVIQSGRKRSTRRLINRVSRMKVSYPNLFSALVESASVVSWLVSERLVRGDMESLGRLLTYNHAVLSRVGASDSELDHLVDLALSLGCHGAKLTGAGGGGSVLAVPGTGDESELKAALRRKGFESFEAVLPAEGVKSWLH